MKKIIAVLLAVLFVCGALAACGGSTNTEATKDEKPAIDTTPAESGITEVGNFDASGIEVDPEFKLGVVLVGDENEGYTFAHMQGIQKAAEELGLADDQIIWKYNIPEDEKCKDACDDLVGQGCKLIVTNSYGHQSYTQQAAEEYPEVQFIAMTGDTAKASGLENFSNAFTRVYESRYVSGVVAGMKAKELDEAGKLTDENKDENGNIKIGYVGAYPYAEVVSGYTAFYLGIKSVVENVVMDVQYTNSWFDMVAEGAAADALMARGCVIIGQHADSTGAPSAVQAALDGGKVAYSVGYNVDMLSVAPTAALTSATNNWTVFYKYAIGTAMKGEKVATNGVCGLDSGAVEITALGESCAEGTADKVAEVEAALKDGSVHVFDQNTFTVGGEKVEYAFATDTDGDFAPDADNAMFDGYYHESYTQSAPSFQLRIDGITELNNN
ncbi:MAG: BMP family ABC transporter substrate-binding protein [Ruminococcus sp.]|uniref:BMP family ABC transporter substrate-binding protein n=1 Tax=Ruminococcus sp. TaxID=41978 RepID=UPI002873D311|nr:BMP family ABC transporter substrate-binding protein [Ruminococcus sp.]MBQ3284639.1 BMP family ABC transporter substrate-binding protein [Ruminococcus sp.]